MPESARNAALHLDQPLHVVVGSIGSDVRYELETKDITARGFFLESSTPGRFHFTMSSIVEVWIELGSDLTVFFNAKIARITESSEAMEESRTDDSATPGIQFRIIQIEPEEEKKLTDFVAAKVAEDEKKHASSVDSNRNVA